MDTPIDLNTEENQSESNVYQKIEDRILYYKSYQLEWRIYVFKLLYDKVCVESYDVEYQDIEAVVKKYTCLSQ